MSDGFDPATGGSRLDEWSALQPIEQPWTSPGETLPEQIARRIEELIETTNTIGPGARLPSERELAQIFGVSRLSVREAVHRLEALALVVVRRGAGTFVARRHAEPGGPTAALIPRRVDVEELIEVRRLLEPQAAEWAATRADRTALLSLARLASQFETTANNSEPRVELLASTDVQLHAALAQAGNNMLLGRLIEGLHDLQRAQLEYSLRRPGRTQAVALEHRRIVDAITAGNASAAREAVLAHLAGDETSLRAIVTGTKASTVD